MNTNIDKRKMVLENRQRQIKREKVIILCSSILTILITISIFVTIGYNKYGREIYASAKINEINEQNKIDNLLQDDNIDKNAISKSNSLYLPLEDDPNAEDVMEVSKNTEALLKGEKSYPVRKDGKKVAYLTFDDGPSTENTKDVISVLNKYNIKATFFVTGSAVEENDNTKELVKEIASNGNAIGNHTYSHDYDLLYSGGVIDPNAFMNEINKTNKVLKSVLGDNFKTRAVRFPGGYWSWQGRSKIRSVIDKDGYAIINWNALSKDAEGKQGKNSTELFECFKETTENLGPDADSIIVLMHDTYQKRETVKSLPAIIDYLKNKGFEFKTMK